MRHAPWSIEDGHRGWGRGAKDADQPEDPRKFCENSEVWAFANFRLTVELGRSHIEAELREFIESN